MSIVVAFPRHAPSPGRSSLPPADGFYAARQVMLQALSDWLATSPSAPQAAAEIDGTINSMRAILDLLGEKSDAVA